MTKKEFFLKIINLFLNQDSTNADIYNATIKAIGEVADPPEDDGESDYEMFERLKGLPEELLQDIYEKIPYYLTLNEILKV